MGHALWVVAGMLIGTMLTTLAFALVLMGELRGGLEAWAEGWMRVVTLGRWNAQEEDDDGA